MKKNSRRQFLNSLPFLAMVAHSDRMALKKPVPASYSRRALSKIRLRESYLVFVGKESDQPKKQIPEGFLHTHYPPLSAIPSTKEVDFPWKKETFTNGALGAVDQLGAINEGVYVEGNNIIQIIASTPGTPDTGAGSPQYKNWYRISTDQGKSFSELKLIVVGGHTKGNPVPQVLLGRNGFTTPFTSPIFKNKKGEILVPVNLHPWDDQKGKIYNPADAFLFGDSGVLIAKWNHSMTDVTWEFGKWLRIDHNRSTRGLFEPSLAELNDGKSFAMVCRGSNFKRPELPSYAWTSFSDDQCRTWTSPQPFTYSDGTPFYVPASCSTLFRARHTGTLYWIGNLSKRNPDGNHPRNPLVIGQVDEKQFGLIKSTVLEIDQYHPESEVSTVELSNFKVLEHNTRNEIVVVLTRRVKSEWAKDYSWYHIDLDAT